MNDQVAAFPLCWPDGWPRTKTRKDGRFADWTVYTASVKLREELGKMGATGIIVSSSVPLRRDGIPLSQPPVDKDPGVAIYFTWQKKPMCIACDRYTDVADNIRALTLTLEALRAIERHGSTDLLNRAFTGFEALPERSAWHTVLGVDKSATPAEIDRAYRALAKVKHPDVGGSEHEMAEINAAYEAAKAPKVKP